MCIKQANCFQVPQRSIFVNIQNIFIKNYIFNRIERTEGRDKHVKLKI